MSYANELVERLQLDPHANLKRMSKEMKQKTALVAAFINNRPITILDESTIGLDRRKSHTKRKALYTQSF